MSELKIRLDDDEILKSAYNAVYGQLQEPIGLLSQAIPETPNLEHLSALQIKALVEKYDTEIKLFKNALTGKITPRITVVEPDTDNISVLKGKRREQEHKKDIETIRQGLAILEKRRRPYAHRLLLTKIQQFQIAGMLLEGQQINQEASKIKNEIQEHYTKIKEAVKRHYELQSRFEELNKKFGSINLDQEKITALTFTEQLPPKILDFAKN
jgi:hypothetical protein